MKKNKILQLNNAYNNIRKGIKILEKLYENNYDVRYYFGKLKKVNDQLNKKILRLIKNEMKDW